MKRIVLPVVVLLSGIAMTACMSTEEKKKRAEEEGNAVVAIKSKFVKGAGDALKTDGKEAAQSASEGIGEVVKGINSGFDKSISQATIVPDETFSKTFEIGRSEKFFGDTCKNKRVSIYLVANEVFNGKVILKAFDESKKEIGRSTKSISLKADDAKYYDFAFDNRIPLLQAATFTISIKQ